MSETPISESFGPVAPYYDELMAGVPYRFWADYTENVWAEHAFHPKTVLDLACGTGTMSRMLTRRGYAVTGVDLSPGMLEVAQRKTEHDALPIIFHQQDAAELDLGEQRFDAAVCFFDSLNNILEPERLAEAFNRVYNHLNPGGSFLFDVNTEFALAEGMFNQSRARRDEPLHYRWRSRYDPETRLCTVNMRFVHDTGIGSPQVFTEVHRQRAYHKEEIVGWLQAAGFSQIFIYDSYTTDPPKKRSDRLFYLAVRQKQ